MADTNTESIQNLDIPTLLKQVKDTLSFPVSGKEERLPEEVFFSLLDGSFVPNGKEEGRFVSPILILDKTEGSLYPFFFSPVMREEHQIRLASSVPYLNHYCLSFLKDLGVEISDPIKSGYRHLYDELMKEIERAKIADKIDVLPSLMFFDESALIKNNIYDELVLLDSKKETRPQFLSLYGNASFIKGMGLPTYDDSVFTKEERILNRLSDSYGAEATYDSNELRNHLILSLIDREVLNGKKVLFALPDAAYQSVRQMLKEEHLFDFVFEYTDKLVPYFQAEHVVYDYEEPMENGSSVCQRFYEVQKRYDELIQEENRCFFYPKKLIEDSLQVETPFSDIHTMRLDVRNYTDEDYEKDCCFLERFVSQKGLSQTYYLDHPFYGLTCSSKRENYDSLELLIIDLISDIRDFASEVTTDENLVEYGWNVNTLGEYLELSKNIQVLRGYNGFPKKYFRLNQDDEERQDLSVLKSMYQACSASRLLVSGFFYENIFIQDLNALVSQYQGFLGKMKVKHKLRAFLKNKKNPNFDALMKILSSYCQAQNRLKEALPSYIEVYGDNVMTMNGVVEIESNIRYIQSFRQRTEELPEFTIDEPFVKKWMNNRNFRNQMDEFFLSLDEKYQEIKASLNGYIGYFLDGKRDFSNVFFDDILQMLKTKSLLSYDDFCEYAGMKKSYDEASMTLQLTVRKYENEHRSMSLFAEEYRISLLKSFFLSGMKKTFEIRNEYEESMKEYFSDIPDWLEIQRCDRYNRIAHLVVSQCHSQKAEEEYIQARKSVLTDLIDDEALVQIRDTLRNEYPIVMIPKERLYEIHDEEMDTVVLVESSEFDDAELLSAYQCGEHVLILNKEKNTDNRILSYHDSNLSMEHLSGHLFRSNHDCVKLWARLKPCFDDVNLNVTEGSEYYPYLIPSKANSGCYYGPVPNLCMNSGMSFSEYKNYRNFLGRKGIALIPFDAIGLLLSDSDEIEEIRKRISEYLSKNKE